jgi:hypothetical protein
MEQWIYLRLQSRLHHHLRDPIRYGRNHNCLFPALSSSTFTVRTGGGSSCPTTSDSRSGTGCLSTPFRNPQSIAHRLSLLLDWLLPADTLPIPPISKLQTALPHSSAPPIPG